MPAPFRSYLSNLGYNGIICFPSFNNQSIESWSQDRIEKISSAIDALNPFEEKKDYFATSILSESINLQFDSEGRISLPLKLLKHAKIRNSMLFVGQGRHSKFGSQLHLKNLRPKQEKNLMLIEQALNGKRWVKNNEKDGTNCFNAKDRKSSK